MPKAPSQQPGALVALCVVGDLCCIATWDLADPASLSRQFLDTVQAYFARL
jgi:hypothetical protein